MEEIGIIELLQRVKEGKAPRKIEVMDSIFEYNEKYTSLNNMYLSSNYTFNGICLLNILNNFDTKIKILDEPIIEKINITYENGFITHLPDNFEIMEKINEIINWINNKE